MSVMSEMPFRRSRRGPDATGSLLFDRERDRHRQSGQPPKHTVRPDFGGPRPS